MNKTPLMMISIIYYNFAQITLFRRHFFFLKTHCEVIHVKVIINGNFNIDKSSWRLKSPILKYQNVSTFMNYNKHRKTNKNLPLDYRLLVLGRHIKYVSGLKVNACSTPSLTWDSGVTKTVIKQTIKISWNRLNSLDSFRKQK